MYALTIVNLTMKNLFREQVLFASRVILFAETLQGSKP